MIRRAPRRAALPHAAGVRGAARRGRALRVLLIALGLMFLQGPRLLHLLLVPHATCEHGELVEVSAAHAPSLAALPDGRVAHQDRVDAAHAAHADGAGHDHCDALALRHCPAEVGAAVAAPSLLLIAPLVTLVERDEARPVPLLSLAPKSSPPAG